MRIFQNRLKTVMFFMTILFTLPAYSGETVYENAESGLTTNWSVYVNESGTAIIENIYDTSRESKVIKFSGDGLKDGYTIGARRGLSRWNNTTEKKLHWSMNYSKDVSIYILLQTVKGARSLKYTNTNKDNGLDRGHIHHGLGSNATDGTWREFNRDLEVDLKDIEPNNSIISVNAFMIRGSGKLDNLKLYSDDDELVDTTKPIITLTGNAEVNITKGSIYTDAGATAFDNRDGNITAKLNITSTVNTAISGTYSVKYNVKDNAGNEAVEVSRVINVNNIVIKTGSLIGQVLDISGNAIANATVQVGSVTRSSDTNGNFSFNELNISNRAVINVSKSNYLNNSKIVQIQKDLETTTIIVLAQENRQNFSSSEETTIEGNGGGVLTLPADIYVDSNGNSFSGEVELSLNYYPISTPQGREMFPGNFDAVNSSNERGTLRSYGFVTMSLQDNLGNPLNINGSANITIPADLSLGTPPATIPLWYYDEDRGIWVEDGVATYDEATESYQGAITRIAVYNLDVFMNPGNLKVCVEDSNGVKLSGAYVHLENPAINWFAKVGPTNNTGYINILNVMGNTNINLSAYLVDGRYGIYSSNPVTVTPNVDNELPSCIVVAEGNSSITGVVQELGTETKLNDVKVVLRTGGVYLRELSTDTNGQYNFTHLISGLIYSLEYVKVGFLPDVKDDITLVANEVKNLALVELTPNVIVVPNQAPVANAGVDKSVTVNQAINLVGTGTDSDGSIVAYEWKEGVTTLANTATFDYTPTTVGEHNLTLTVTDDDGAVGSDSIKINVIPKSDGNYKHTQDSQNGLYLTFSTGGYKTVEEEKVQLYPGGVFTTAGVNEWTEKATTTIPYKAGIQIEVFATKMYWGPDRCPTSIEFLDASKNILGKIDYNPTQYSGNAVNFYKDDNLIYAHKENNQSIVNPWYDGRIYGAFEFLNNKIKFDSYHYNATFGTNFELDYDLSDVKFLRCNTQILSTYRIGHELAYTKILNPKNYISPDDGLVNKHTFSENGHSYYVYDTELTWKESKAYCQARGLHLATITSEAESNFLKSKLNTDSIYYWLGATDEETEGTWKWITGEAWDYTNWNTEEPEPNNMNGKEHYLHIYASNLNYTWNDLSNESDNSRVPNTLCEDIKIKNTNKSLVGNKLFNYYQNNIEAEHLSEFKINSDHQLNWDWGHINLIYTRLKINNLDNDVELIDSWENNQGFSITLKKNGQLSTKVRYGNSDYNFSTIDSHLEKGGIYNLVMWVNYHQTNLMIVNEEGTVIHDYKGIYDNAYTIHAGSYSLSSQPIAYNTPTYIRNSLAINILETFSIANIDKYVNVKLSTGYRYPNFTLMLNHIEDIFRQK